MSFSAKSKLIVTVGDRRLNVSCAAVTGFYVVAVEYFGKFLREWEAFLNEFEK